MNAIQNNPKESRKKWMLWILGKAGEFKKLSDEESTNLNAGHYENLSVKTNIFSLLFLCNERFYFSKSN